MLTLDDEGNVWWTEGWIRAIGRLTPSSATPNVCGRASRNCVGVREYPLPPPPAACPLSHTSEIVALAGSDEIWFSDSLSGQVGKLNTATNVFTVYALESCAAHADDGLTSGDGGSVWWTEQFANRIGRWIEGSQ